MCKERLANNAMLKESWGRGRMLGPPAVCLRRGSCCRAVRTAVPLARGPLLRAAAKGCAPRVTQRAATLMNVFVTYT